MSQNPSPKTSEPFPTAPPKTAASLLASRPYVFDAKVMHKRLFPRENSFVYDVYYLSTPLSQKHLLNDGWRVGVDRHALLTLRSQDHGYRTKPAPKSKHNTPIPTQQSTSNESDTESNSETRTANSSHPSPDPNNAKTLADSCTSFAPGAPMHKWAHDILDAHNLSHIIDGEIVLITLPRVLGYVFNPVSFWLCYDSARQIRAVICEVNNTFGESHSYLCVHDDVRPIHGKDSLIAQKLFHVSPFLEREGHYTFRFDIGQDKELDTGCDHAPSIHRAQPFESTSKPLSESTQKSVPKSRPTSPRPQKIGIWIDFYDGQGQKKLLTALTGSLHPYSRKNLRKALWKSPLVTIKTMLLIHWQAVKLFVKKAKFYTKPTPLSPKVSRSKSHSTDTSSNSSADD